MTTPATPPRAARTGGRGVRASGGRGPAQVLAGLGVTGALLGGLLVSGAVAPRAQGPGRSEVAASELAALAGAGALATPGWAGRPEEGDAGDAAAADRDADAVAAPGGRPPASTGGTRPVPPAPTPAAPAGPTGEPAGEADPAPVVVPPAPVVTAARPGAAAPVGPPVTGAAEAPAAPVEVTAPPTPAPSPVTPTVAAAASQDPSPPGPPADAGAAAQVLALTNAERAAAGCGPLSQDPALARAAQAHAVDMVSRGYVDHVDPDGTGPAARAAAAGWAGAVTAENITVGRADAASAVAGWLGSDAHRATVVDCDLTATGVGHDPGQAGPGSAPGAWVQLFGG